MVRGYELVIVSLVEGLDIRLNRMLLLLTGQILVVCRLSFSYRFVILSCHLPTWIIKGIETICAIHVSWSHVLKLLLLCRV